MCMKKNLMQIYKKFNSVPLIWVRTCFYLTFDMILDCEGYTFVIKKQDIPCLMNGYASLALWLSLIMVGGFFQTLV